MGLGWQLTQRDGNLVAMHSGSEDGYKSRVTLYPKEALAIIVLANSEKVPREEITEAIHSVFRSEAR